MEKHLLDPARLRKIPPQFSWIDQRLVREHHIERLSHAAAALYLFLLTVADASGLSFYSERSIGRWPWPPSAWITPARSCCARS